MIVLVFLGILFFVSRDEQLPYWSWAILSAIFLFLSIDEISSIHEHLDGARQNFLGATTGLFYYAWVIPYTFAVSIFALSYLKFLTRLPKKIRWLFIISGAIFILGAVGFEMLGGWQAELFGNKGLLYSFFYTCEELFEMVGIALFIYTLLTYIVTQLDTFKMTIKEV